MSSHSGSTAGDTAAIPPGREAESVPSLDRLRRLSVLRLVRAFQAHETRAAISAGFAIDRHVNTLGNESVYCFVVNYCYHHRLNGSSSPVLTATSLSYGESKNSTPPQNQNPWTDWDKIWQGWLSRRGDPSCKIFCKFLQGGLLGKWVKYTQKFF